MEYTFKEEVANSVTHAIGVVMSIAALVMLIVFSVKYGDIWHVVSFTIFGVCMVLLYSCSTLLHATRNQKLKDVFEILDHSAIYLLIAGTYTPFLLVTLRGTIGWSMFGIVWGLALIGIVFKIFFVKRFIIMSTLFYILMGLLIIFAIKPLYENLAFGGMLWLVIGGLLYTVGSIFYVWRKIPYHHAIWHVFVLAGSVSHFVSVLFYVLQWPQHL